MRQILTVKCDSSGVKYWHCKDPGWVPHRTVEMSARNFSAGTKVTITYPKKDKDEGRHDPS